MCRQVHGQKMDGYFLASRSYRSPGRAMDLRPWGPCGHSSPCDGRGGVFFGDIQAFCTVSSDRTNQRATATTWASPAQITTFRTVFRTVLHLKPVSERRHSNHQAGGGLHQVILCLRPVRQCLYILFNQLPDVLCSGSDPENHWLKQGGKNSSPAAHRSPVPRGFQRISVSRHPQQRPPDSNGHTG